MEITEVRIKLMDDPHDRLQAFCSITFDNCFVIRDLKIIQGTRGPFLAMPSRKLTDRCPKCHTKNHLRAVFCSQCGVKLGDERAVRDDDGRARLYADIAHPINSRCREMIQDRVLDSFAEEQLRAREPDYVCRYDDYGEENYAEIAADGENQFEDEMVRPAAEVDSHSPAAPLRDESDEAAEESPQESVTFRSGAEIHRIDPGTGPSGPAAPHGHGPSRRERFRVAAERDLEQTRDDGDDFGAGLV